MEIAASPDKDEMANLLLHAVGSAQQAEELLSIYSTGPQRQIGLFTDGKAHTYLVDARTLPVSGGSRTAAHLVFSPMDVSGSFELYDIELLYEPDYSRIGPQREGAIVGGTFQPSFVFGGGDNELLFSLELAAPSRLHFSTARREASAPARIDVDVLSGDAWERLLRVPIDTKEWADHTADLSRFGSQSIDLRFTMSAPEEGGVYYLGSPLVAESSPRAPLVVIYLVDTLRADHLSVYGYPKPTSPNLEAFARSGTLFEHCYPQATWTKPSITSFFTGLAPDSHRAGEHGQSLSTSIPSLGGLFRAAGFVTVSVISNAHAGWSSNLHRGFDRVVSQSHTESGSTDARDLLAVMKSVLERHRDEPLLLYAHFIDPHLPYEDPDGWGELFADDETKEAMAAYDGEIRYVDKAFGTMMEELRTNRLAERAVVVFASDHGENFREGVSLPHGTTLEQAETQVPLIFFGKGRFPEGRRISTNVQLVDVLPTLLELYGIEAPPMDGRSLLDLLDGGGRSLDVAFSHSSDSYQRERATVVWSGDDKLYARADGTFLFLDLRADEDDGSQVYRRRRAWRRGLSQNRLAVFERLTGVLHRYLNRPKVASEETASELDAETIEQLRALGYVP